MIKKVKFNKFERIAGIFVLAAFFSGLLFLFSVAIKQGWFDSKVDFQTQFESADGIHVGTAVQMAGLKAGSVEQVDLISTNKIQVKFYVLSKFQDKIKKDSIVQLIRPFIIGERVLDITVGSETEEMLAAGSHMPSHEAIDLMTLMSGRQLGDYLASMSSMMGNLKNLAEAFLNKDRTEMMVKAFDRVEPLLMNLNVMSVEMIKLSKQVTKDENIGHVFREMAVTTQELNKMLPDLAERAPEMAKNVDSLIRNMALLTEEFKVLIPALKEVAPDLPAASRRALEALDEAVVLMKAMQRSFLVKSNADDIREEERQEIKKGSRKPATGK
jgi:phospholipid/cholesterol/gamma-HCH transport system substrate-binding protein